MSSHRLVRPPHYEEFRPFRVEITLETPEELESLVQRLNLHDDHLEVQDSIVDPIWDTYSLWEDCREVLENTYIIK